MCCSQKRKQFEAASTARNEVSSAGWDMTVEKAETGASQVDVHMNHLRIC